jgi:hypothetical protein
MSAMTTQRKNVVSEAEIEALIAEAMRAEAAAAAGEAAPPSGAIVWWRSQMRARQEAARAVERPLTIVHALAIACGAGLFLSIVGTAIAGVKGSLGWLTNLYGAMTASGPSLASIDLTSRWIVLPMAATIVSILVASIAAVIIFADE